MTTDKPSICLKCIHYDFQNYNEPTCKAFKKRIPDPIWIHENDHSKPLPDQKNDIVFEPIETKPTK